jgi:hypothetical protein
MDLTEASMLLLSKSCLQLESLTFLQPHWTNQFKFTGFMRFVETCRKLTSLNLSMNCLTDAIVDSIAQSCPGLLVFYTSHNNALTDIPFISVANKCKQLKSLNISYNKKLTNDSLLSLAKGCRQLQILDISHCCGLTLNTEPLIHASRLLINLQNLKSDELRITELRIVLENEPNLKS